MMVVSLTCDGGESSSTIRRSSSKSSICSINNSENGRILRMSGRPLNY